MADFSDAYSIMLAGIAIVFLVFSISKIIDSQSFFLKNQLESDYLASCAKSGEHNYFEGGKNYSAVFAFPIYDAFSNEIREALIE